MLDCGIRLDVWFLSCLSLGHGARVCVAVPFAGFFVLPPKRWTGGVVAYLSDCAPDGAGDWLAFASISQHIFGRFRKMWQNRSKSVKIRKKIFEKRQFALEMQASNGV